MGITTIVSLVSKLENKYFITNSLISTTITAIITSSDSSNSSAD